MGQYYLAANLDKREHVSAWTLHAGAKLMEIACSAEGVAGALAILLSDGNGRGGGDLRSTNAVVGSWAGDRVVLVGDYADPRDLPGVGPVNLYQYAAEHFTDISLDVASAMFDDPSVAREWREHDADLVQKIEAHRLVRDAEERVRLLAGADPKLFELQ